MFNFFTKPSKNENIQKSASHKHVQGQWIFIQLIFDKQMFKMICVSQIWKLRKLAAGMLTWQVEAVAVYIFNIHDIMIETDRRWGWSSPGTWETCSVLTVKLSQWPLTTPTCITDQSPWWVTFKWFLMLLTINDTDLLLEKYLGWG